MGYPYCFNDGEKKGEKDQINSVPSFVSTLSKAIYQLFSKIQNLSLARIDLYYPALVNNHATADLATEQTIPIPKPQTFCEASQKQALP